MYLNRFSRPSGGQAISGIQEKRDRASHNNHVRIAQINNYERKGPQRSPVRDRHILSDLIRPGTITAT
jgi:hypothetical protein